MNSGGSYVYNYNLTDHLGNVRYSFDIYGGAVRELQRDDYYAFGKLYNGTAANKYLYNGKELQEELGQYDYGARFYDPEIGRFTTIDPVAEHFPWMTSYQYASNDPVGKIDLDGLEGVPFGFLFGNNSVVPRLAPLAETTKYTVENIAKAGGEIAGETVKSQEQHHVVPRALKENPFVKESREGGFKFEGKENKIGLDKFSKATGEGEHGSHPNYTSEMSKIINEVGAKSKGSSPTEKADLLRDIVRDTKELINNNRGTKTNDLFKKPTPVQDNTKVVIPSLAPPPPPPPPQKPQRVIIWA